MSAIHVLLRCWHATIGQFRYIDQVKCPYRVADKASALSAGKREPVENPYRFACEASALSAGNDIPRTAYYKPTPLLPFDI